MQNLKTLARVALFLVCILAAPKVFGASVSSRQAQAVVQSWLRADTAPLKSRMGASLASVETYKDAQDAPLYYVVYLKPSGFAIVSADDLVEPIVAFAEDGVYDPSSDNPLGALISRDLPSRMERARKQTGSPTGALKRARNKWVSLQVPVVESAATSSGTSRTNTISDVRVSPLVQSKWSQGTANGYACYNYFTPPNVAGSSGNYPCGCVATAMAQLMRYHQYPTSGVGTASFAISVDGVTTNCSLRGGDGSGGAYLWDDMPLVPSAGTTVTQRQAIGALTYDAGVAVKMMYTASSSGAYMIDAKTQLKSTFKYSNAIRGYNYNNDIGTNLVGMVNPNLDAGYPVLFGIRGTNTSGQAIGHAIVCDGYGYNLDTLYHHLNLGWAGNNDAWYALPTIDTSVGYTFTSIDECIYNVYTMGSGEIISGQVTDSAGSPLSNATVTAVHGGSTYTTNTNTRGIYAFPKMPANFTYTVSASNSGYVFTSQSVKTGTSIDGSLSVGNRWAIDFTSAPVVTLSLSGSPMAESGGVATVTATLSATYTQDVTVSLAFSGTATAGVDYIWSGSNIVIAAGSTTNSITLTAVQDALYESNETVIVDISSVVNGTESGTQQVTATILDDDFELTILPAAGVSFTGSTNGVISPSSQVYMLTNAGAGTLSWTASRTNSWIILSATNGTLAAGAATNVTVSVITGALAEGTYSGAVTFSNATRGVSVSRPVSLAVTPPYIYFFPLDTNPGWTTNGGGQWAFGQPTGQGDPPDPTGGFSGNNVFGVNLNGNYSTTKGGPYYLKAGPFNFSGYTNVSLHFQRWLNTDWGANISATVEVSSNGTAWAQVYANDSYADTVSTEWSLQSIDISSWADRRTNVYVRWGYQILNGIYTAIPHSGWNIDDVGFLGASTVSLYTVTFDAQGGSAASPASITVANGAVYGTLAATTRAGYAFGGWWTGAGGTGTQITSATTVTVTSAQTLYAMWTVLNTSQGTPCPWLDQYGLAAGGDYEAAALADTDGDGCAAWQEYIAGTDPTNGQSFFNVSSFELPSGGAVIRWNAVTGRVYGVHRATNLLNGFLPLATNIVWPQSSYTDTVYSTEPRNFYEIKVRLSP